MAELDTFVGKYKKNVGIVFNRKEGIRDLPHKILGRWESYLLSKKQLVMGFSLWNLRQKTARVRHFVSFFYLRPGIIKLHVVNFLLNVMSFVVRLLTWTIFVALVVGVLVLFYYGLEIVVGWGVEFVDSLRSEDPSDVPEGVE